MSEEERASRGVIIKLTAIVALDGLNGGAKLHVHVGKKI